jgi:uncharacterized protein with GYD domain
MNANYMRGRRAEYAAKKLLESWGATVIRAAGSKGPYDLIAVREPDKVLGVQIKATSSKTVARGLLKAFKPKTWEHFDEQLWVLLAGKWYRSTDWGNTNLWD